MKHRHAISSTLQHDIFTALATTESFEGSRNTSRPLKRVAFWPTQSPDERYGRPSLHSEDDLVLCVLMDFSDGGSAVSVRIYRYQSRRYNI